MKIIKGFQNVKDSLLSQARQQALADDGKEAAVREIVAGVRERGDVALFDFTEKLDGVRLTSLEVEKAKIEQACRKIDADLRSALELAADRITAFHREQKERLVRDKTGAGLGWVMRPLRSVGVYTPGFQAPLPSSVLMTAVPARVAGVDEIILATPPDKEGNVSPVTLAAAKIAGIDRVFSIGGAPAVAALAYGTESVPRVDKICGPGNIYLSLAKKQVFGDVGIDGLYGPSEVIIIADDSADPEYCAADLLAQAEHGSGAAAILVTTSAKLADSVNGEIEKQLGELSRRSVAAEALYSRGMIGVVADVDEAVELVNLFAPEHLCLVVTNAASYIEKVKNAGCLFLGEDSLEALVDYVAGPSHVLPTGGTARFGSPLNILDFVKLITVVNTGDEDITSLGKAASVIARAEGLDAHARAIEKRLNKGS
ncbi:MAG: histidinol dehydrogenase [Dehalococcoidia bacterium]